MFYQWESTGELSDVSQYRTPPPPSAAHSQLGRKEQVRREQVPESRTCAGAAGGGG